LRIVEPRGHLQHAEQAGVEQATLVIRIVNAHPREDRIPIAPGAGHQRGDIGGAQFSLKHIMRRGIIHRGERHAQLECIATTNRYAKRQHTRGIGTGLRLQRLAVQRQRRRDMEVIDALPANRAVVDAQPQIARHRRGPALPDMFGVAMRGVEHDAQLPGARQGKMADRHRLPRSQRGGDPACPIANLVPARARLLRTLGDGRWTGLIRIGDRGEQIAAASAAADTLRPRL
jgi:hypothetical protein